MNNYEKNIGKNIREVRNERGLSQEKLAERCNISNTTLSMYENSKKIPSLSTIAKIAKSLGVSIERLYYGDENSSFINSEPDLGKKIVNSIYFLWEAGIIEYYENYMSGGMGMAMFDSGCEREPVGLMLNIMKHAASIRRLVHSLNEYRKNKDTYPEPEKYLEMLLASVATEINNEEEEYKRSLELIKERDEKKYGPSLKK